jgi:YbgC/YbaW family acyl-CoA thioester hydrolase
MTLMFRYHLRLAALYLRWRLAGRPAGSLSTLRLRASAWDCDWLGHINNGRYLELFDCGRVDLFLRLGLLSRARRENWHLVVGGMNVRYRREVRWGDRFTLETGFLRIDGKTLLFRQVIRKGDTVATEAEATIVVVKRGKAVTPDFLRPLLEEALNRA